MWPVPGLSGLRLPVVVPMWDWHSFLDSLLDLDFSLCISVISDSLSFSTFSPFAGIVVLSSLWWTMIVGVCSMVLSLEPDLVVDPEDVIMWKLYVWWHCCSIFFPVEEIGSEVWPHSEIYILL